MNTHEVVVQKWKKYSVDKSHYKEYSLHQNDNDRCSYIKEYESSILAIKPGEWSYPHESPYTARVASETLLRISKSRNGIGYCGRPPRQYVKGEKK